MPVVERMSFGLNIAPGVMSDFLRAEAFKVCAAAHRMGMFGLVGDRPSPPLR
jgi:hypothetical protein